MLEGRYDSQNALANRTIAVAGVGAIGAVIGGCLSRSMPNVWLIDSWWEHVRALQRHGLCLEEHGTATQIEVKALHSSEIGRLKGLDILLIAVKSYDTAAMVSLVKPCLKAVAFAVSCQNGINEETIASILGPYATLGCLINWGAILVGPGHVKRLTQGGNFVVGELDGKETDRVKDLALLLSACAQTKITDNLWGERWSRLAQNCIGNPLLTLTGYSVQELHAQEKVTLLLRTIILELINVAEAFGHRLVPIFDIQPEVWKTPVFKHVPAIEEAFSRHARALGNQRSSMDYDLEHGRPLEIDYLNGYIVRKGEEVGVSTPINRGIVAMVKDLERGLIQPGPENLATLLTIRPGKGGTES
jgi:2-dehydropantoate 2-reductase